jgi:hypothetical protein
MAQSCDVPRSLFAPGTNRTMMIAVGRATFVRNSEQEYSFDSSELTYHPHYSCKALSLLEPKGHSHFMQAGTAFRLWNT